MINIDMWYGDKITDVDRLDIFFSDIDCVYRGNIYKSGKCIGDYTATDSVELENNFPDFIFNR